MKVRLFFYNLGHFVFYWRILSKINGGLFNRYLALKL